MLSPGDVHLWWGEPRAEELPELLPLLSAEELAAANRYIFERHRLLSAWGHGVLRQILALYTRTDPRSLVFERTGNGKPELRDRAVRFNLSHTVGLVLIGVTQSTDIGVDAEYVEKERGRDDQLAARVFAPSELAAWRAESGAARLETFFDRWTLKEAYIKARGDGLSLDLRRFGFPGLGERPRIESAFDDADAWQFLSFAPTSSHRAAAAIRATTPAVWSVTRLSI